MTATVRGPGASIAARKILATPAAGPAGRGSVPPARLTRRRSHIESQAAAATGPLL